MESCSYCWCLVKGWIEYACVEVRIGGVFFVDDKN